MVRRKRDDDSSNVTFNSSSLGGGGISGRFHTHPSLTTVPTALDGSSTAAESSQPSLAFDASSMSAAGSFRGVGSGHRPHKRQRKTLTDALQQINLNRDVPQQILEGTTTGAVGGMNSTAISDGFDGDDSSLLVNRGTSSSGGRDVDDDDDDDGASGLLLGLNGVEDYDDNSQLTASDDDDEEVCVAMTTEAQSTEGRLPASEDMEAVDGSDDDEIDGSEKSIATNDVEKAQRKAMLDLLLGKNRQIVVLPGKDKAIVTNATSTVDRKIEELLRQSLQNVQQGAHPLEVKQATPATEEDDDDDDLSWWKSQDDMAIDPRVYHNTSWSTSKRTTVDQNNMDHSIGYMLPPPIRTRQRSNSLPHSMDLDVDYENSYGDQIRSTILNASQPNASTLMPQNHSMAGYPSNGTYRMMSTSVSDVDMD